MNDRRQGQIDFRWLQIAAAAVLALTLTAGVLAGPQKLGEAGRAVLIGGVGTEERDAMLQERDAYNVWLVFVERGTGNYLSGVKVNVTDGDNRMVIDAVAQGPWLMAQLPPGHYTVRTPGADVQSLTVGHAGRAMAVIRVTPSES
jgi:hypothetical protein